MLVNNDRWCLWAGDVKTAFLQETPDQRHLPLFLSPPTDGVTKLAGTFKSPLYRIEGNVYGLASAPRTWGMHVIKMVTTRAQFTQHSLDKMFFYLYTKLPGDTHDSLAALLITYVDDFMLAHNERWDGKQLLDLFQWGSQEQLSFDKSLTFKGNELSLRKEGDVAYLALTQTVIESMKVGNVECKKRQDQTIQPEDMPEMRPVAGCLQWLSGQTRSDVSATVSLSSKGGKSTYKDLLNMYTAVADQNRWNPHVAGCNELADHGGQLQRQQLGQCNGLSFATRQPPHVCRAQGHRHHQSGTSGGLEVLAVGEGVQINIVCRTQCM